LNFPKNIEKILKYHYAVDMDTQGIGKRVLEIRKQAGLTQTNFAKMLGISYTTISTTETGKTPLTEANLKLICLTFGINEQWLKEGTEPMKDLLSAVYPEEQKFLEAFRTLSPELKKMVVDHVFFLLKQEKALNAETPPH
jgi:transcriptional regulator with XRE-family HTH domain